MIYTKKSYRGYLFIGLTIAFFATSITLFLFLIQGKQFSPEEGIVQTGVIRLNTVPNDVKVYVNGNETSKNGNIIRNVPLGNVTISIEQEGFSSWEKNVEVTTELVKEYFVRLYPEELNLELIESFSSDYVSISKDGDLIIYTVLNDPENNGIWKYSLQENFISLGSESVPERIYEFNDTNDLINTLSNNPYEIIISENNSSFLLKISDSSIFSFSTNKSGVYEDIVNKVGFIPEELNWLNNNQSVLVKDKTTIYDQVIENYSTRKILLGYDPNIESEYCLSKDSNIVYISEGSSINVYESTSQVISKPRLLSEFNNIIGLYCTNYGNAIIVEDLDGLHYVEESENYRSLIGQELSVIDSSVNGRNLLLSSKDGLLIYNIKQLSSREFNAQLVPLDLEENDIAYFSESNSSIIIISQDELSKRYSIDIADVDGNNRVTVLEDVSIDINHLPILKEDNSELTVFFKEEGITSLYSLRFE